MHVLLAHASRQSRSWLIFDVRQKMKKARFDPWAFNPEKFLAKDAKKHASARPPGWGEMLAITFSESRRKAFIARLVEEAPAAFYRGEDATKIRAALAVIHDEIKKELASMGVAQDEMLVNLLFYDVMRDPDWMRARREKKA
jgi:hypothetical protein